ncbi:MAG: phage replisome organizer N-terminal domain-containing protein [Clostridia bacterium]|nr:phage replisome organizer N-terminal domain-containing protein [Clostridia bacterium]
MAEVKWVKLTTDMFDNRKIKHLRRLPEGNNIVLIWVMLLTMAGRCNSGGMIFLTENIPYTPKMLADELDFEENTVALALKALEQLDMIVTDNGVFSIAGWEEYQNIEGMEKIREQNRLRQKKWYDRQKALEEPNAKPNVRLMQPNALEEEEEKDKEKEFHSINHSSEAAYIQKKIDESELEGEDAEVYKKELQEGLKLKYMGGTLGQGIIFMSDEQFSDLCDKYTLDEIDKYFGIIVDCERAGKHYKKKSHYQAVIDMANKDRKVNL